MESKGLSPFAGVEFWRQHTKFPCQQWIPPCLLLCTEIGSWIVCQGRETVATIPNLNGGFWDGPEVAAGLRPDPARGLPPPPDPQRVLFMKI